MNEGLRSPDGAAARAPSLPGSLDRSVSGSVVWAITLHSAAGQRWLRHDPPQIEELERTLAVIENMCALLEPPAAGRRDIAGPHTRAADPDSPNG